MVKIVESAASGFLEISRRLANSPLARRVTNANYFSSLEMQEKMLADTQRIEAYSRAIVKYVREGDVVVDLGTGTGILAFLAHARRPRKIYAIDHSSIVRFAAAVASSNQLHGIEFAQKHSRSFRPREEVDVIVHDQIGSWVFNEDMVASVLDLRRRLLKKGGRILPNRFEVYFEPAQLRRESFVPIIWEHNIGGVDYRCLENEVDSNGVATLMLQPHDVECLISEPKPMISFDLESLNDIQEIPNSFHYRRTIARSGSFNGCVLYFKAFFDDSIVVDTTPVAPYECLAQRRLPFYRAKTAGVQEGDKIEVELRSDDWARPRSWGWRYGLGGQ